jgi:hypothetical protein
MKLGTHMPSRERRKPIDTRLKKTNFYSGSHLNKRKIIKFSHKMKIKIKILRIIDLDAFSLKVVMILMQVISTIQTQITYLIRFKYMA